MKEKEWNLSEKRKPCEVYAGYYTEEDVKTFIQKIEEVCYLSSRQKMHLRKLAGDKFK